MTDSKRIFVDTLPIIYFLQQNAQFYNTTEKVFLNAFQSNLQFVTSTATIEEYLVFPYKMNRADLIVNFENFLDEMNFEVLDINRRIANKAAQIRGKYTSFKALDALQLSAAVCSGCGKFLTNDRQLKQFSEIEVSIIGELE